MVVTCVTRNTRPKIFIWETVEHGAIALTLTIRLLNSCASYDAGSGHGDNIKDTPWIRILRLASAWAILICLVFAQNFFRATWRPFGRFAAPGPLGGG